MNVSDLGEEGGVPESTADQGGVGRERSDETNGGHLAEVADHGCHWHLLQESLPYLHTTENTTTTPLHIVTILVKV